jgi:cation transport protein ChaC
MVFRTPAAQVKDTIEKLWFREMPNSVYVPRWLAMRYTSRPRDGIGFHIAQKQSQFYGRSISFAIQAHFSQNARGRYGTTLDYALETHHSLKQHGIEDKALAALLEHAKDSP